MLLWILFGLVHTNHKLFLSLISVNYIMTRASSISLDEKNWDPQKIFNLIAGPLHYLSFAEENAIAWNQKERNTWNKSMSYKDILKKRRVNFLRWRSRFPFSFLLYFLCNAHDNFSVILYFSYWFRHFWTFAPCFNHWRMFLVRILDQAIIVFWFYEHILSSIYCF